MRECDTHDAEFRPGGGGVCACCLRERLEWLWRGEEGFRDVADREELVSSRGCDGTSVASVRREVGEENNGAATTDTASHRGGGARDANIGGEGVSVPCSDIVAEWTEFHARRRRGVERNAKSRSLDSIEVAPLVDAVMMASTSRTRNGSISQERISIVMSAQKLRTRSMPMDNRIAEDTASRVIREEADELYTDDLDLDVLMERDQQGGEGIAMHEDRAPDHDRCLWPTAAKSTHHRLKWIRLLLSPLTPRNKVFPSRSKEDTRKGRNSRKRLTRFASSDWSHTDESSPHWLDALRMKDSDRSTPPPRRSTSSTMRSSLLSWLQDSERSKRKRWERAREELTASFSSPRLDDLTSVTDTLLRDLVTVGHLHEIAEEVEEEEELDDVPTPDSACDDMDSFGMFLLNAAERQPSASFTRLSSAGSSS